MKVFGYIVLVFGIIVINIKLYHIIETYPNYETIYKTKNTFNNQMSNSITHTHTTICNDYYNTQKLQTYTTLNLGILGLILNFLTFFKLKNTPNTSKIITITNASLSAITTILTMMIWQKNWTRKTHSIKAQKSTPPPQLPNPENAQHNK